MADTVTTDRDGVRCTLMRGGTSKGACFLAEDLPADPSERDDLLLRLLGSPDGRQIDGIGGGHPLTSKVAVVSRSVRADADVDYLFLQVDVSEPRVSAGQPCGNILAAVGPFAVERGLYPAGGDQTTVRIHMVNTGGLAEATFATPAGRPAYAGATLISGVPFPAAPVRIVFADTAGAVCGSLLPTGQVRDTVEGVPVTCVDNGMPVVLLSAADAGQTGYEDCASLEANGDLTALLERIRLGADSTGRLRAIDHETANQISTIHEYVERSGHEAPGLR